MVGLSEPLRPGLLSSLGPQLPSQYLGVLATYVLLGSVCPYELEMAAGERKNVLDLLGVYQSPVGKLYEHHQCLC